MEFENNTLLAEQVEQQSHEEETATAVVHLDTSDGIDLLSASQNEMTQAVVMRRFMVFNCLISKFRFKINESTVKVESKLKLLSL